MRITVALLFTAIAATFPACASLSKSKLASTDRKISTVALLPIDYPAGIQREKVTAIAEAVGAELRNRGYEFLSDRVVSSTCSTPACAERDKIAEKYLVDAFVKLNVGSVSRTNFLAGYYNVISGSLTLSDRANEKILDVQHTERQKGGLLFNSGQVFQGLISTFANTEQASFNALTARFAKALVDKLPIAAATQDTRTDAVAVEIDTVEVKNLKPHLFQICVGGTPNSFASVIVNRKKSNLRESSVGRYCGNFFLDGALESDSPLSVELRSAFGNAVRREVVITSSAPCILRDLVQLSMDERANRIEIGCEAASMSQCQRIASACLSRRFIVFRADDAWGPYRKVAEFKGPRWTDRDAPNKPQPHYQIVAVDQRGTWSSPETPRSVGTARARAD